MVSRAGTRACRQLLAALAASGLAGAVLANSQQQSAARLELRADVVVTAPQVRIGDLLRIEGLDRALAQRLAARVAAPAPLLGQTLTIERGHLQRLLSDAGVAVPLHWTGAAVAHVRREAQQADADALCGAAVDAVRLAGSSLPSGSVLDARCEGPPATAVGVGPLDIRAQATDVKLLDGLQDVAVELRVAQHLERVVRVPVRLSLTVPQWCAREGVAAGQPVTAPSFEPCRRPALRPDQLRLAGQPLPRGRLKRALRIGDLLVLQDVADVGTQMRGDAVTVVYRVGALALESRGELSQDARVGDAVRVRLQGHGQSLSGRLAAENLVELAEQP